MLLSFKLTVADCPVIQFDLQNKIWSFQTYRIFSFYLFVRNYEHLELHHLNEW